MLILSNPTTGKKNFLLQEKTEPLILETHAKVPNPSIVIIVLWPGYALKQQIRWHLDKTTSLGCIKVGNCPPPSYRTQ